jgi:hypothetical protein
MTPRQVSLEEVSDLLKGGTIDSLNWGDEIVYDDKSVNGFGVFLTDGSILSVAVDNYGRIEFSFEGGD